MQKVTLLESWQKVIDFIYIIYDEKVLKSVLPRTV